MIQGEPENYGIERQHYSELDVVTKQKKILLVTKSLIQLKQTQSKSRLPVLEFSGHRAVIL